MGEGGIGCRILPLAAVYIKLGDAQGGCAVWWKRKVEEWIEKYKEAPGTRFGESPYRFWRNDLFTSEEVLRTLPRNLELDRLVNLGAAVACQERLFQTAHLWWNGEDDKLRVAYSGVLLTKMYLCLAYPRETILSRVASALPEVTAEARLCARLVSPNSTYRHVRNALAHGTVDLFPRPQEVLFRDRDQEVRLHVTEAELLIHVVLDIIMGAYEALSPPNK